MRVALPHSPFNRADLFEAAGFEVVEGRVRSTEDFIELMRDADGAQVGVMPLTTRAVMEACPKLKVVSRLGVGVDSIDHDAATELGVMVCNVPGSNTTAAATTGPASGPRPASSTPAMWRNPRARASDS
jgi:D-3-phosphoglycerate dehydrogenase